MSFKDYIIDRLFFIVIYYISIILTIIIMSLDLMNKQYQFNIRNILYVIIISTFILIGSLFIDYHNKREFYKALNRELNVNHKLNSPNITKGFNKEQRVFNKILIKSYNYYNKTIKRYKRKNEKHLQIMKKLLQQMKISLEAIKHILESKSYTAEDNVKNNEIIEREIDRLYHIVYIGLYILEIHNFNIDLKKEEIEVINIVKSLVDEKKDEFISNSISCNIDNEENIKVKSNKEWIKLAIDQIISNAINYTKVKDMENKHIHIKLYRENENSILQIEDNGIGIPNEDIDKIFKPFFTGENGKWNYEAIGLGLYLTKEILDKLRHKIEIKSVKGMGTIVKIIF